MRARNTTSTFWQDVHPTLTMEKDGRQRFAVWVKEFLDSETANTAEHGAEGQIKHRRNRDKSISRLVKTHAAFSHWVSGKFWARPTYTRLITEGFLSEETWLPQEKRLTNTRESHTKRGNSSHTNHLVLKPTGHQASAKDRELPRSVWCLILRCMESQRAPDIKVRSLTDSLWWRTRL